MGICPVPLLKKGISYSGNRILPILLFFKNQAYSSMKEFLIIILMFKFERPISLTKTNDNNTSVEFKSSQRGTSQVRGTESRLSTRRRRSPKHGKDLNLRV